ncbi:MAG TPA: (deoxy)nucleoside triphosphate pyrophosphohydrolase [Parvularculaceae bacterium]|nr:(deoxy)nucleoside triphosphate pyrophosphohydrolase [Parvularculaceae bacterium]
MAKLMLVSAGALIDADGRVLIQQRPASKAMGGLWEFPGGKIADGEAPEAALVREFKEELALDIAPSCLAPFGFASEQQNGFNLLMLLYVCRKWSGSPRALEGQRLAWVRPDRLADHPMPPADRPLAAQLRDFL